MRSDLMSALIQIEHDKGLKREVLISAIEEALLLPTGRSLEDLVRMSR